MYLNYLTLFFLLLALLTSPSYGHADGAPLKDQICTSMHPFHGEVSMSDRELPYKISLDTVFIPGGGVITIKVESTNPSKYTLAGFFFMMKPSGRNDAAAGTFDTEFTKDDLKTIPCFGKIGSAVTHVHNKPKTSIIFRWNAPNETSGLYEFHSTLVRDFNSYWVDIVHHRKIEVSVNAPAQVPASAKALNISPLILILAALVSTYLPFNK